VSPDLIKKSVNNIISAYLNRIAIYIREIAARISLKQQTDTMLYQIPFACSEMEVIH